MEFAECLVILLITTIGVITLYKANNTNDGKDFLKRFFAITWVVGCRVSLAAIIITGLSAYIFYEAFVMEDDVVSDYLLSGYVVMFEFIYYALSIRSFVKLKHKREELINTTQ